MTTLRAAAGQAVAVAGDIAANVVTAAELAREAGERGARLLVLPEAFVTGYCRAAFAGPLPTESALPPLLEPLSAAASDHALTVVVSSPLDRGGRRTLSTVVVAADGSVTVPYDKQHLSGYEKDHFVAGDHGASILVDGWEFGLGICYDASFPEHARDAALHGAHGYLVSAAFFPGGAARRDLYAAARALDNGMYVVFSGLVGTCGDEELIGGSAIYDPEGVALDRVADGRGLAVAELDLTAVRRTRERHPMLRERRVDLGPRTVGPPERRSQSTTASAGGASTVTGSS